jgi:precorrin-4/cobalt-precorrin-4 C11-methyltransferase
VPGVGQTVILTRTSARSTPMPPTEDLATLGAARTTLVLHLAVQRLAELVPQLVPHYGADCPAIIVYRATWPDEEIIVTTLAGMRARVREEKITRTALVFVGPVFGEVKFRDSRLYAPDFAHVLRNAGKKKSRAPE